METPISDQDDEVFTDPANDFPFYDCPEFLSDQSDPSMSTVTLSDVTYMPPPEPPIPATSLHRRSFARFESKDEESNYSSLGSSVNVETGSIGNVTRSFTGKRFKLHRNLKENEESSESAIGNFNLAKVSSIVTDQNNEDSTLTPADDEGDRDDVESAIVHSDSSFNFLMYIAELLIKAIGFQIGLFFKCTTFPIWVLYNCYMFAVDPFGVLKHGKEYLSGKFCGSCSSVIDFVSSFVHQWLKDRISIWKFALRCLWGLLWSFYVGFILCGLLVWSMVISGFMMSYLVEEPIQMKEMLNFDYTKHSPVAYVPIVLGADNACGLDFKETVEVLNHIGLRVISPKHKLQVTVSMKLPESEYNKNLGIFQVRVDFLSANGRTFASLSQPCMLHFRSEPIRILSTFLKIVPLLAGYVSETQILNVKIKGFTEGHAPTACLKVIIEQRAEYPPGAGIPEMYDASLLLESELPLFKRILWYWKRTIFIWTSMVSFIMELLFTLLCCRPMIIPRARPRDGATNTMATHSSIQVQN